MKPTFVASTQRRLTAHLLDGLLNLILMTPSFVSSSFSWGPKQEITFDLRFLIACMTMVFLLKVVSLLLFSATFGKALMGLRLIGLSSSDRSLTLTQVLIRVMCDYFSIFFGWGLFSLALFRLDRRHLSDWLAETQVVQFYPRAHPPERRVILGTVAVLYFSVVSLSSTAQSFRNFEVHDGKLVFRQR